MLQIPREMDGSPREMDGRWTRNPREIGVIRGGIRGIRRIRGIRKSQFIHQYRHQTGRRQSPIRKKEGTEGSVPRGDKGDKGG